MRRVFFGLLFLILLFGSFVLSCQAVDSTPPEIPTEGDVWDGNSRTRPSQIIQIDGQNYYKITKCSELAYVATAGEEYLSRNYILANNLILNNVELKYEQNSLQVEDPENPPSPNSPDNPSPNSPDNPSPDSPDGEGSNTGGSGNTGGNTGGGGGQN